MSGTSPFEPDVFVAALRGDESAAATIVVTYAQTLADRVGALVVAHPSARRAVVTALARCGELPGGELGALTWPPVAGRLLGRIAERAEPTAVVADLHAGAQAVLGEPVVVADPWWLHGRAPGAAMEGAVVPWVQAFAELDAIGAGGFARAFTRTLSVRAGERPDVEGSWSSDEAVGSTVLMSSRWNVAFVSEALLHEAVHHCQGMYEVDRSFVLEAALVHEPRRYPSPWTGNELTAKSFLAAVFVWYALALAWSRDPAYSTRAERAAHGFLAGDPAGTVASFGWALDPVVPDVVASLQREVRGGRAE